MRITGMNELSQILSHIRQKTGTNEIQRQLGTHKTVIKRLREVSAPHGWDQDDGPVPNEEELAAAYKSTFKQKITDHFLDPYRERIKKWKEDKESYVVICHKLNRLIDHRTVAQSTLRDYYNKKIGRKVKLVNRRLNDELGVAELDFGFLGNVYDTKIGRGRKSWFISIRYRWSRQAVRRRLYKCDTFHVLAAIVSIFEEMGAVPVRLVIDNFKVAIVKASRHDPTETQAFRQLALHYGFVIDPCIPNTPEHKGGVETDVKYVKKNFWPLYKFDEKERGHNVPYGDNIDEALIEWDKDIAGVRPIREAGGRSPHELFFDELPHLKPLPGTAFEPYSEEQLTLKDNYHVRYDKVSYSAPWKLTGKKLLLKAYAHRVLLFFEGNVVARHIRSYEKGVFVTESTHRPDNMREYLKQTMPWLVERASLIGENTLQVVYQLAEDRVVYRKGAIMGIIKELAKTYGEARLEKACARALHYGNVRYGSIKQILIKGKDREPLEQGGDAHGQTYFYRFARTADHFDYNKKEKTHGYNIRAASSLISAKDVGHIGEPG